MLGWVADYLARQHIPDLNCGFRVLRRDLLLRYLHLLPDGFSASTTTTLLFLKQGHSVHFLPTVVTERSGTSTVRPIQDGMRTVMLIVRLITLLDPFRVFFPMSRVAYRRGAWVGRPYHDRGLRPVGRRPVPADHRADALLLRAGDRPGCRVTPRTGCLPLAGTQCRDASNSKRVAERDHRAEQD